MGNACILHDNLVAAAGAVLSVSDSVALAPGSNLLITPTQRRWICNGTSAVILVDYGSTVSIDTSCLEWLTGVDPTFRLRLSTVDATGLAGDAYDSGSLDGAPNFDPDYGRLVFALAQSYSCRYMRIDLSEAGVDSIGAGYLTAGLRDEFETNFQAPWTRTAVRGSVDVIGVGGQTFVDLRQGYWKCSARFGFLSETQKNDFVQAINVAIVNTGHKDFLWLENPESDNLSRDCIFGYIEGDQPITQDLYTIPPVFSVEYPIRQRL